MFIYINILSSNNLSVSPETQKDQLSNSKSVLTTGPWPICNSMCFLYILNAYSNIQSKKKQSVNVRIVLYILYYIKSKHYVTACIERHLCPLIFDLVTPKSIEVIY